jgi:dienelactone hydrolase
MNTQYLELAQGRLAFDDRGTGPLVICVPSMGDVRQEYRFLALMLVEAGYRVASLAPYDRGRRSLSTRGDAGAGRAFNHLVLPTGAGAGVAWRLEQA